MEDPFYEGITAAQLVPQGTTLRTGEPFKFYDDLYLRLAQLERAPEGILDFANFFGPLGAHEPKELLRGHGPKKKDTALDWIGAIDQMAWLVQLMQTKNFSALTNHEVPVSKMMLVQTPPDGVLRARPCPQSLLHGMQLQFTLAVSGDYVVKTCRMCKRWFEAGGERRRRDAEFCSKEHKVDYHNLKKAEKYQKRRKK